MSWVIFLYECVDTLRRRCFRSVDLHIDFGHDSWHQPQSVENICLLSLGPLGTAHSFIQSQSFLTACIRVSIWNLDEQHSISCGVVFGVAMLLCRCSLEFACVDFRLAFTWKFGDNLIVVVHWKFGSWLGRSYIRVDGGTKCGIPRFDCFTISASGGSFVFGMCSLLRFL